MKIYCIYTSDIFGMCSANIIKSAINSTILIESSNVLPEIIETDTLFVIGCVLPEMDKYNELLKDKLIWIDNNVKNIKSTDPTINGSRNIHKSICELTYETVYSYQQLPKAIELLSSDKSFKIGLNKYIQNDINSKYWKNVLNNNQKFIVAVQNEGKLITKTNLKYNKNIIDKCSFNMNYNDYENILCCNLPLLQFESIPQYIFDENEFFMSFYVDKDQMYNISIWDKNGLVKNGVVKSFL